jgi:hypothetical protein
MKLASVGIVLVLLIAIFFLFRLGHALATGYFNDSTLAWIGTGLLTLIGFGWLSDEDPRGFLFFIPICTYIFLKIINGLKWETSIKKRAQAVALSTVASAAVYVITSYVFEFGVTEASLGAIIAIGIFGLAGYTAG